MIEPLLRKDEILAALDWPALNIAHSADIDSNTTFILASGFEDRAIAFLLRCIEKGSTGFRVIALDYQPYLDENRRTAIEEVCARGGAGVVWVVYDRCSPAGIGDRVLRHVEQGSRVLIDVSGMSRLLIVQMLVAFVARPSVLQDVCLIYTEASDYPPTEEQFEQDCAQAKQTGDLEPSFISSGVQSVAVIPELSSPTMLGQSIRLIAFPSFNRAQLRAVVDEIQPTYVELIDGIPPRMAFHWRIDAIRRCNEKVISSLPNVKVHAASTLDYQETLQLLFQIYSRYSAFDKLVVAPMGSKMQGVAVGIARAFLTDLQVVYPIPMRFTEPQTHTVGVARFYELDLSNVRLQE